MAHRLPPSPAWMHYGNDLSFLTAYGIFPAEILSRSGLDVPKSWTEAALLKGMKSTAVRKVNGSGCSPEHVGSETVPIEVRGGVQVPKYCCLLPFLWHPAPAAGRADVS